MVFSNLPIIQSGAVMPLEVHTIAKIFPSMSDSEFQHLKEDIAAHGQREAVWLYEGKILDGRHRARACEELDRPLRTVEYDGFDPTSFVVSLNLHRRHLSESQRGMVAAKLSNLEHGGNRKATDQAANLPLDPVPQSKAAEMLNVSERTVRAAVKIKDSGVDELVHAVEQGTMSVSLASQVASLPEDDVQAIAALNAEPQRMREVALETVHNHRAQGTGENEWYTPVEYVESARHVMGGIELDPASSELAQASVMADEFFTIDDDGLTQEWEGSVWLNPPYAQPAIQHFVDKLVSSTGKLRGGTEGDVSQAILLTHNYTDTAWFQSAAGAANAICFTRGRIGFLNPEGKKAAPTQGQAFFYFGLDTDAFVSEFKQYGFCVSVVAACTRKAKERAP